MLTKIVLVVFIVCGVLKLYTTFDDMKHRAEEADRQYKTYCYIRDELNYELENDRMVLGNSFVVNQGELLRIRAIDSNLIAISCIEVEGDHIQPGEPQAGYLIPEQKLTRFALTIYIANRGVLRVCNAFITGFDQ